MSRDIGWAVRQLKAGRRVRRMGWNGKGMWLTVHPGSPIYNSKPWVGMKTVDDNFVPWTCSQTDFLADDWELAE